MAIYLIIVLALVPLSFINNGRGAQTVRWTTWTPLLVIAFLGGLRYQTGYDWMAYQELFDQTPKLGLRGLFGDGYDGLLAVEPGFYAVNYVFKHLDLPLECLFLAFALFNAYCLKRLLETVPCNAPLAILFHVGFGLVLFYFSAVRQAAALALILLASREIILQRPLRNVLFLSVGASLFQASAFMYLPALLYAHFKPKVNIRLNVAIVLSLVITSMFFDLTSFVVETAINSLGIEFFLKYATYVGFEHETSPATYGFLALNGAAAYYIYKHPYHTIAMDALTKLALASTLLLMATILAFPANTSVWTRMMMYSSTMQGVWFGAHVVSQRAHRAEWIVAICAVIISTIHTFNMFSNQPFMVPYQSVFNKMLFDVDNTNEENTIAEGRGTPK